MRKVILLCGLLMLAAVGHLHAQTVQCQTASGAWGPCPLNASVQLFSAQAATGTATSTAQKVYNFSMNGAILTTFAGITGSPSGCTVQIKTGDSLGNLVNNGSAISETVSNGSTYGAFVSSTEPQSDEIEAVWSCSTTYPSAGTISLEYVPSTVSVPVDSNGYLKVNLAANSNGAIGVTGTFWQATQPVSGTFWQTTQPVSIASLPALPSNQSVNIAQLLGSAPGATNPFYAWLTDGTNAAGAFANYGTSPGAVKVPGMNAYVTNIPAVTQSGNWTARSVGNGGAIMDAAAGAAAGANSLLSGCEYVSSAPTLTTGEQEPCLMDAAGNHLVNVKTALPAGTNNVGGFMPTPTTSSSQATAICLLAANTTAASCKSGAGNLYGFSLYNPNSTLCVLQIFNTSSVTLGTTQELLDIPVLPTGGNNYAYVFPVNFSADIYVASTTAAHGASTCSTGMLVNLFYE
jgi:hypothetical protein